MNSRMDKYYDSTPKIGKRSQKNAQLYKEVSKQSLEDFHVNSNATVLSDNGTSIDLKMLKDMLDKKYNDQPKVHKSLGLDLPQDEQSVSLEQTKEYDINAILEKARESKTVDYETERLKKLRDTQYDILKSLDLTKKDEEIEKPSETEEQLMDLINTITINEQNNKEAKENQDNSTDPLDLFKDLKGDENTQVIEGLKEQVNKETKKDVKEENEIDKSFYTKSFNLKKDDFEDFKDLEEQAKSSKVVVTVLTVIIIIALLFGIFLFLNIYLDWGII